MRIESASSSDDKDNSRHNRKRSMASMAMNNLNLSMSIRGGTKAITGIDRGSLMGQQAPLLYEAALVGNWSDLLKRLSVCPSEGEFKRCYDRLMD